jgi:phenylpyruvate tautomerase PptA (4-oxalocrotonate tautomerase family)
VPLVRVEVRRGRSEAEKAALLESIHRVLVEALRIPDDDRTQRLIEHDPGDFEIPPGKSDRYTLVEITMFPGRSLEAKKRLYQGIVGALGEQGVPASDVLIVLHEPPLENWGVQGGLPASEVDLGFDLDV